ncbi:hypothetical protein SPI_09228 [Niveomyces insectorum RCEF 264]|uniref:Uncharacterized protein n=1 Tax=Niveomyces insectorum RCEF 264 TaxID=1081102 RepID=A0A167M105_9HYPO|nr:hypothetical protein SPI_09228 [Niveomyces insectorum RCEF 264]
MGGSAFASGPDALYTPRMSPAVYRTVRDRCHVELRALFVAVATPIEGPGKVDFGDVDVLVSLPRDSADSGGGGDPDNQEALLGTAAARLGAVRVVVSAHEAKASLAIPWPDDQPQPLPSVSSRDDDDDERLQAPGPVHRRCYIQVDLAVAPTLPRLQWALFRHAHGDFWPIVGAAVLRPHGLTLDEHALWLRVPEIERAHRQRAKVFLTDEPAAILHFLGLRILDDRQDGNGDGDGDGEDTTTTSLWEAPFPSAQALFVYITTCRFFVLPPADDDGGGGGKKDGDVNNEGVGAAATAAVAAASKAHDRRRLHTRPLFRQWVTEFVPACGAAGSVTDNELDKHRGGVEKVNRDTVRAAAFARFPDAEARYTAARTGWLRMRHAQAVRAAAIGGLDRGGRHGVCGGALGGAGRCSRAGRARAIPGLRGGTEAARRGRVAVLFFCLCLFLGWIPIFFFALVIIDLGFEPFASYFFFF